MTIRTLHGFPPRIVGDSAEGALPCFGIVPRGLLKDTEGLACAEWLRIIGALEAEQAGIGVMPGPGLDAWRQRCAAAEVATWSASRNACHQLVSSLDSGACWDVWQIKEGHTSSVWRVTRLAPHGGTEGDLCINIARDRAGSEELEDSVAVLRHCHECDPLHVAAVSSLSSVEIQQCGRSFGLAATLGPWIAGRELHLRCDRHAGMSELIEVDGFVSADDGDAQRIAGRALTAEQTREVLSQWHALMRRCAMPCDTCEGVRVPQFNFNDGDFVLAGGRLVAVACEPHLHSVEVGAWEEFFALSDPLQAFSRWAATPTHADCGC